MLIATSAVAQVDSTTNTEKEETLIIYEVGKMAEFPGGMQAFSQYIASNLKYPEEAKENGAQGKVYISFVVDTTGNVTDAKILTTRLSGTKDDNDYCLGQCALDVVAKSPTWTPATQRGRPVRMRMNVPISFKLQ